MLSFNPKPEPKASFLTNLLDTILAFLTERASEVDPVPPSGIIFDGQGEAGRASYPPTG